MTKVRKEQRLFGLLEDKGFVAIPVRANDKRPAISKWEKFHELTREKRAEVWTRYPDRNIGLLAGTRLTTGNRFGFVDIDHDGLVGFISAILHPVTAAKTGSKGRTIFCQVTDGVKSAKLKLPGSTAPAVEVFANTGMTVIPPSIHPGTMRPYSWYAEDHSLLNIEHADLPVLDLEKMKIIRRVVESQHAKDILAGGSSVKGHDLMLKLTSCGIANAAVDLDWLASCLNALFAPDYRGDTRDQTLGMLETARKKGLGTLEKRAKLYDPGDEGPIPLGYTKDGLFALLDPVRQIVLVASSSQLLSWQYLSGLRPSRFWASRFPSEKTRFDQYAAGEALMEACIARGSFNPIRVRGRGIWLEDDRIVMNLGEPLPAGLRNLYLCFEPIKFDAAASFETERLLAHLQRFPWRNTQDAMLLLGWLALAPICGVLEWRPHCFIYGPPGSGKTTILNLAGSILDPLVILPDGQSTEAGIRQSLGPDSLPIVMDEFESDHDGMSLRRVLRLARSASSANTRVLRGTPEGKAMQFSLRTTFLFGAVNTGRMTPADQSRTLLLELQKHDSNDDMARLITSEQTYFHAVRRQWCAMMISRAHMMSATLGVFEPEMPSGDLRHRRNIATLLSAAFLAINGRVPSIDEVRAWSLEYAPAVARHAEDIERDNSQECLDHLLAHVVEQYPLGHWIASALPSGAGVDEYQGLDADRILTTYGMKIKKREDESAVLIQHGSPNIEKIFERTAWAGRAWQKALHALPGAFSEPNPVNFANGAKSRCIGIPERYIPEPIETRIPNAPPM